MTEEEIYHPWGYEAVSAMMRAIEPMMRLGTGSHAPDPARRRQWSLAVMQAIQEAVAQLEQAAAPEPPDPTVRRVRGARLRDTMLGVLVDCEVQSVPTVRDGLAALGIAVTAQTVRRHLLQLAGLGVARCLTQGGKRLWYRQRATPLVEGTPAESWEVRR